MSKKIKNQKFTFKSFIRTTIFILLIYFAINWLSRQNSPVILNQSDSVLGDQTTNLINQVYQKLPENSRQFVENFNQNPTVMFVQEQLADFPNRQIKEIQKAIIKNVSEDMIKNLDQK